MTSGSKAEVCADAQSLTPLSGGRPRISGTKRHLRRAVLIAASLYLAAMVCLAGLRPLWLDEILQLLDTRQPSTLELLARLPSHHIGSAPLGYLTQQAAFKLSGYSLRRARLTAAIFGALAVAGTLVLGLELELSSSWAGALLFALFPLTVRYSTESRPYSEALFFSLVATILYMRLVKRPAWAPAGAYSLALAAAAYTQPYAASVGLAHILWSVWCGDRKAMVFGTTAAGLALAAFMPWFWWSHAKWAAGIAASAWSNPAFRKLPLVLFRECVGAGYWGSGLLLILCVLAWTRRPSRPQTLLVFLTVVPAAVALVMDSYFGYFLAARQFLWILPPVALWASSAWPRNRYSTVLLILLGAVCVWQTARYLATPRENWQVAADSIAESTAQGACLAVAPPEQASLYEFFRPALRRAACGVPPPTPPLILAITPYATDRQQADQIAALRSQGFTCGPPTFAGGSILLTFRRPAIP